MINQDFWDFYKALAIVVGVMWLGWGIYLTGWWANNRLRRARRRT